MLNKLRKGLSLLLVLCVMLSALPVGALADDVSEDPAVISAEESDAAQTPAEELASLTMGTKPADGTTTGNPFVQGTGDSNSFRIPAMVTLNDGTIVAAADARWNTTYDGGGLDTIVSYSTDNGASWNYTFANYLGDNGNVYNGSGSTAFIDPALATDGETVYMLCDLYPYGIALNGSGNTAPSTAVGFNDDGTLKLAASGSSSYNYYLKDGQIYDSSNNVVSGYSVDAYFNITGNGYDTNLFFSDSPYQVVRTGYLYLTSSTDGGKTWSAPTLIPNVKTSSEQVCLVGPGRGIVTYVDNQKTIVFPVYKYNGSSDSQRMGFIYSKDEGATWARVDSSISWSSESAVVELADGTLRFFYRNGNSKLYYVDYSWTSGWGSAVNTGIATNSNTQISAISLQNTVDGKQVILVSCPTGSNNGGSSDSSASARLNGRIQIGLVDPETNATTWKTPIDVTTNNSQFMYSCLTALTDEEGNETGRVAILYENRESAWGTGSNCYYTMDFKTYDLGLTFDEVVDENTYIDSTGIVINFGTTDVSTDNVKITSVNPEVLSGYHYVAYDISVPDFTGSATVTIPLDATFSKDSNLYAVYIDEYGDIAEKIDGTYDSDANTFTFTATHFSTYAVVDDPSNSGQPSPEEIILTVGESKTVTDETGNYESSYTGEGLDTAIATVDVKGGTTEGTPAVSEKCEKVTSLSAGTYLIGNGTQWLTLNGSTLGYTTTASEATQWTIAASGSSWTIKSGDYYLYHSTNGTSISASTTSSTWNYSSSTGFSYTYNYIRTAYLYWNGSAWTAQRNVSSNYGAAYTYTPAQEAVAGSAYTTITFTGVSYGTTTAIVGTTTYNITVNRKTQNVSLSVGGTATYTDASANVTVADSSVASATLSGGKLTITGVAEGTTTVTTDTTVYTVNVATATLLTVQQGGTKTISVTLEDGQYVKWSSANSSYVGVAGVYDANNLAYTDEADVFGQQVTDSAIEVTGTIYNSDGTVASASKWLVTVTEAATGTTSVSRYFNVDQVENCVLYYSINGGQLVPVNGTGVSIIPGTDNPYVVVNGTWYGDLSLMFFAAPNDGYALTHLYVEDSDNQYYVLSDGENDDVTKSSAWPFKNDVNPEEVYTSGGHTYSIEEVASLYKAGKSTAYGAIKDSTDVWKTLNGSLHGFRWALLEGYVTASRLQELYEAARALGCTGVTTVTKGSSNSTNVGTSSDPISICAVAQKLADVKKEVTKITNKQNDDVTEAGIVKIGYTVSYRLTVTVPATPEVVKYWNGTTLTSGTDKAAISYTNMEVTDSLSDYATGFGWTQTTATSSTTKDNNVSYTEDYTITLTPANFGAVVTEGTITNTATLNYDFSASYGKGTRKSSAEMTLDVTVEIPQYVVDFGLPVEIDLSGSTAGEGSITEVKDGTYGTAKVNVAGNGFTYTPTSTLQGIDYVTFTYKHTNSDEEYQYRVSIIPATTVYYEEGFASYTGSWTDIGSTGTGTQAAQIAGSSSDEYGYDDKYAGEATSPSNGTQATSKTRLDRAEFAFTGTGVDIYTNNTPDTGWLVIQVKKNGATVKLLQVNTAMADGGTTATEGQAVTAYNVPVASITGLSYGDYTVTLINSDASTVNLDGFRVYGTLLDQDNTVYKADLEDSPNFIELRDEVLTAQNITGKDGYATEVAKQVYSASNITSGGAILLSNNEEITSDADLIDLLKNGPKNEIYLRNGQSLVFNITTNREVQIGLKALDASTTCTVNGTTKTLTTSTDMFYTVLSKYTDGDRGAQTITITNTGDGILSITKLKVCDDPDAALGTLTEEDLVSALVSLGYEESAATRFGDISEGKWYYDAVEYVTGRNYFLGTSNDRFSPNGTMTRAMFVTVLGRVAGVDTEAYKDADTGFRDVKSSAYYAPYVAWAKENGIVLGKSSTKFAPGEEVTREEMATFLCRFAAYLDLDTSVESADWKAPYTDAAAVSSYAADSIGWCVENGIITGMSTSTLVPKGNATRAQVAMVVRNLCVKVLGQ